MHVQELLFVSASWQLRVAFCRALALNPARRKNFFSRFYFHRYISLKILQTKLFNKSDQGQARRYAQRLNRLHYRLAIFSFASFLSFSGDFYRCWQFVCFASFSSCLKEFHKRSSGHFATSPQTRENLFFIPLPPPPSFICFLLLSQFSRWTSRGNACYEG